MDDRVAGVRAHAGGAGVGLVLPGWPPPTRGREPRGRSSSRCAHQRPSTDGSQVIWAMRRHTHVVLERALVHHHRLDLDGLAGGDER